jgi:anti-sigma-K factor RskA
MDYSLPERADKLAAEYVLGTLRGRARRRFEALLPAHAELRRAVARWHDTLMPLAASVTPLTPPPHVWRRIEDRLFDRPTAPVTVAPQRHWWRQPRLWAAWALLSTFLLLLLGVMVITPSAEQPVVMVVMSQASGPPSFVVGVAADGRSLVLSPLGGVTVDTSHELELWQLTEQGAPRSLGRVSEHRSSTVQRRRLLRDTVGFQLTLEPIGTPAGGSPSGPVVSTGRLRN